ncbi:MAG: peptidylprolyl isomerase A [Neisseriaceae bacterium]|nr:MAG: peptidylprolyl isomerase A [Neisseriaceae bacterium]
MKRLSLLSLLLCSVLTMAEVNVLMKTSLGDIELMLDDVKAPISVKNFLEYVNKDFYNNTIFHRVIPGFMIQGGGFTQEMVQKNTNTPIINESKNGLKNNIGTIAMARTNEANSATSQFFINTKDNDFLNYKNGDDIGYAVFGKVTKGMDVVRAIEAVPTSTYGYYQDVPQKPIKILSVQILSK